MMLLRLLKSNYGLFFLYPTCEKVKSSIFFFSKLKNYRIKLSFLTKSLSLDLKKKTICFCQQLSIFQSQFPLTSFPCNSQHSKVKMHKWNHFKNHELFDWVGCCLKNKCMLSVLSGRVAGESLAHAHVRVRARRHGNRGKESTANESRVTRPQPEDLPAENTAVWAAARSASVNWVNKKETESKIII